MKKHVLLNLCLFVMAFDTCAAEGVTQDLDKICRITFPAAPQISQAGGRKDYALMTDSCSYLVQVIPNVKAVVHDTFTLSHLYSSTVNGIIRGYHGTLIGTKHISLNGLDGQDLEYVKPDKDHQPLYIHARIFLIYDHLLVYSFSAPYSRFADMKEIRERFFSSFALNKAKNIAAIANADTDNVPTPTYDSVISSLHPVTVHTELVRSGTLKFIFSFALCILLLAGIVYILVRWKKKKTDPPNQ